MLCIPVHPSQRKLPLTVDSDKMRLLDIADDVREARISYALHRLA